MSNERYKSERKSYAVNLWSNKKMQNFNQRKKRKLLTDNIIKMKAVNKFINVALFPVINRKYKNGKKTLDFLTPAEKLDFLRRFCEGRKLRNDDMIKTCHEELIRTHVSGVSYEQ
jgi:hypothetical protein